MGLPAWLLNTVGSTVGGAGKALGLPEFGVSEAIQDPTRGIQSASRNNLATSAVSHNIPSYVAAPQLGQTNSDQFGLVNGTSTAYDPNTDPNALGQARGLIGADQNQLNALYASLNPELSQYATDARGRVDKQYGDQQTANDKAYASGVAGTNAAYGARGAYDSSYRGNDLTTARDAYTQSNNSLNDQKNSAYGQIGSTIQGVQDQLQPDQYDLSQYKDVNSLTALHNQLGQHIASLKATQQQLTPNGELVQKLNSVAAPTSNLDATLKSQLDGLIKAGTPSEAINPLATAFMTRAGITDPAKQKQYFDYLAQIQQQQAPDPATNNLQLQGA